MSRCVYTVWWSTVPGLVTTEQSLKQDTDKALQVTCSVQRCCFPALAAKQLLCFTLAPMLDYASVQML